MTSAAPEPCVAATPNSLEPVAQEPSEVEPSLPPRQSRSLRLLFTYVGLAAALVLVLGAIALLARSGESERESAQVARSLNPEASREASTRPEAATREPAAPQTSAADPTATEAVPPEPVAPASAAPSTSAAETSPDADAARAAAPSAPESTGGLVTVTIQASPPGAIIYDEKRRIGKGVARIVVRQGRKRSMLALLNLHHPRHFVVDGSQTSVHVTLEPMDANAIAQAVAAQERKATRSPTKTTRTTR